MAGEETRAVEQYRHQAGRVMVWAEGLTVASAEEYTAAMDGLKQVRVVRDQWAAFWRPLKGKAYASWKELVAREKEVLDVCDAAERLVKGKAGAWYQEQERKRQAEQARLQAEADERYRREQERLRRAAEKLKTPELREQRLAEAEYIPPPVVTVPQVDQADGVAVRKTWRAEVVDMAALIAAATPGSVAASFLCVNQKVADSFARSTRGSVVVPGVQFIEESTLAVRRGE